MRGAMLDNCAPTRLCFESPQPDTEDSHHKTHASGGRHSASFEPAARAQSSGKLEPATMAEISWRVNLDHSTVLNRESGTETAMCTPC